MAASDAAFWPWMIVSTPCPRHRPESDSDAGRALWAAPVLGNRRCRWATSSFPAAPRRIGQMRLPRQPCGQRMDVRGDFVDHPMHPGVLAPRIRIIADQRKSLVPAGSPAILKAAMRRLRRRCAGGNELPLGKGRTANLHRRHGSLIGRGRTRLKVLGHVAGRLDLALAAAPRDSSENECCPGTRRPPENRHATRH